MNKENFHSFLQFCSTPFHFLSYTKELLDKEGFKELQEDDDWTEFPTKGYVIRQSGAIIAYKYDSLDSCIITTTKYETNDHFYSLSYINNLDEFNNDFIKTHQHPLKCSGYVIVRNHNDADTVLFDSGDEAISFFVEPSELALDSPRYSTILLPYLSEKLNINEEDILDFRLKFVDKQVNSILPNNTIISSNLTFSAPAFSALHSFIRSDPKNQMNIFCSFYNDIEMELYHSPTIFDDFLPSFINKAFCFDLKNEYLQKTFCICLEGFKTEKTEGDTSKLSQIQTLDSNINFGNEKIFYEHKAWNKLPKYNVKYLLTGSTISKKMPIQLINLGIPVLPSDGNEECCSFDAIENLYNILNQVLTEFN